MKIFLFKREAFLSLVFSFLEYKKKSFFIDSLPLLFNLIQRIKKCPAGGESAEHLLHLKFIQVFNRLYFSLKVFSEEVLFKIGLF